MPFSFCFAKEKKKVIVNLGIATAVRGDLLMKIHIVI